MCRILICPPSFIEESLLDFLEKRGGGHGNGIAIPKDREIKIIKGLNLPIKEIVKLSQNCNSTQVLFHTRLASTGVISNGNCQPFEINKRVSFCHNGTWLGYSSFISSMLIGKKISIDEYLSFSDSRVLAILLSEFGERFLQTITNGVFIFFQKEYAKLYLKTGSFEAAKINKKWIYATEFPKVYPEHFEFASNTIAILKPSGFKILEGTFRKKSRNNGLYRKEVIWQLP